MTIDRNAAHHAASSAGARLNLSALALALAAAFPALAAFPASAQTPPPNVTPPDAGQVLRDLRPPLEAPPRATTRVVLPADADTSADASQRFLVRQVRVEGVKALDAAAVRAVVAPLEGQQVSLGELRQAAQRITQLYRQNGYIVARAFVPAQQVADGQVLISVLESALSAYRFDNRSIVPDSVLAPVVDAQRLTHQPITADALDRTLLLLADLPGVGNVTGNLKPGERVGTSDLLISADPGPRVEGDVSVDSYGNRYTGENRLNAHVTINSPRGVGDRLDLRGTVSDDGLLSGRVAYDLPLSANGLRGGAAFSSTRYELGREFSSLDANGTANTVSLYGAYPLVRGVNRNIWFSGTLEHRDLRDKVRTTGTTTDKQLQAATLEAYGDLADALGGGGYSNWRVAATAGHLDIQTAAARLFDDAGPRTAGGYGKLQLSGSRLQSLPHGWSLAVSGSAQLASKNLDSSEKFVVGGAYGVRAYPQGQGVGDEGWLLNIEIRHLLAAGVQGSLFYDAGGAQYNHKAYAAGRNSETLRGYGLGLLAQVQRVQLRAAVAWRDGAAPTVAPDRDPRLWVSAGYRF